MSARIPADYAELTLGFKNALDPEPMLSSIGLAIEPNISWEDAGVACEGVLQLFADGPLKRLQFEYTLSQSYCKIGQDVGEDLTLPLPLTAAGENGDQAAPPNVAYLVRKYTTFGGRRGRGRMYLPGVDALEMNSAGDITGDIATDLGGDIDSWFADIPTVTNVNGAVLLHNTEPFTPTSITALALQSKVATQRRRLRP